ncbi:MAG TPA: type III-B CRISPR-associated protein Cas10/Cmr2 [Aggregatilineales bacterium]|nr:type III-B CRISPR-associated protein Cas10/Cmr2 [Anaerolineales bacterium]HRE46688.1 type III-B CRISPR-associated protein Cas10/Cmr2 [Aggregatilineales bacterium]
MTHLYLFQIGPVQSFIAAARRTQDLYVGSRLLSLLARAGIRHAQQRGVTSETMIFPAMDGEGDLPRAIPHRFAFLSEDGTLGAEVEKAIRTYWLEEIVNRVEQWLWDRLGDGEWTNRFKAQTKDWLECFWVCVPYDPQEHGNSYTQASKALAIRRQLRNFTQLDDVAEFKCTLTGAGAALSNDGKFWDTLRNAETLKRYWSPDGRDDHMVIRKNEQLGALALIKRVGQWAVPDLRGEDGTIEGIADVERVARAGAPPPKKDEETPLYLAVLHMDGDRMGKTLSQCRTKAKHQEISYNLAVFAQQSVPDIVTEHKGVLIYAGGDDVLALLPLKTALPCANKLRLALAEVMNGAVTASAGIALMKTHLPLDSVMDEARAAEKSAKNDFGRDAVVIRDSRSTAIRAMGAKWDQISGLMEQLQRAFDREQDWLSSSIGYDILTIAEAFPTQGNTALPPEAREAELRRLLKRRISSKAGDMKERINDLAPQLAALGEAQGWDRLGAWLILARLLASGGVRS